LILQINEDNVMPNIAAINSTEVKTIVNWDLKILFVVQVKLFTQRFM